MARSIAWNHQISKIPIPKIPAPSPLKYFEYLYGGLNVIASDFPSHRTLPYNKMISFFNLEDKNSLTNALQNLPNINSDKNYLTEITVDKRVKKIIELIN